MNNIGSKLRYKNSHQNISTLNPMHQYIKRISYHDQVRFIPDIQGLFNIQ
jgi:hypothetical protein